VTRALKMHASVARQKSNERFFKTGPGEYGEGDEFLGVSMSDNRKVAKQFRHLHCDEIAKLLESPIHEHRMCGLLILVLQYDVYEKKVQTPHDVRKHPGTSVIGAPGVHGRAASGANHMAPAPEARAAQKACAAIVRCYLAHIDCVNSWDLVDCSAPQILGAHYIMYGGEAKLYAFAKSRSLWHRRVAIVGTAAFIVAHQCEHTLAIAELLLNDKEDLIHKATGWMLREVGKRDKAMLETFLRKHVHHMPRTCLRYAIERFAPEERACWLNGER